MLKNIFIGILLFASITYKEVFSQSINQYKDLLSQNKNDDFPKTLIYDAAKLPITYKEYNQLGFKYISTSSLDKPSLVPNKYKYIIWTGVASNDAKAKWSTEKSPFVSDIDQYTKRWDNRLKYYKRSFYNQNDKDEFGVMVLDIESKKSNEELNKEPPYRTQVIRNKERAITDYKIEMEKLYRFPLEFAKSNHNYYKTWSSYSDVPVERNWWGIPSKTWEEWTTDPSHLNYITHTIINNKAIETEFSKNLDFYTVSTYFFYNPKYYDLNTSNQYLAYLLFQLEANQAWSDKPIFLYFTFKYQASKGRNTLISKEMVRNSVIFAFISGADGIVLYDDSRKANEDPKYHSLIETFVSSISELNRFRDYFVDKNVIFYKPDNARDLFVDNRTVIRGIEKNRKLLIAATNPFARAGEITRIPIYYKGKYISIELVGNETFLKEFPL